MLPVEITLHLAGGDPVQISTRSSARIRITRHPKHHLFTLAMAPREDVFVEVKDGRLSYGGERLRLWGVAGTGGSDPTAAERMVRLGFNAMRLWHPGGQSDGRSFFYDEVSGPRGEIRRTQAGADQPDGLDQYHRFFAACKEAGMFIMSPALMGRIPDTMLAQPDSFVSGGADWDQWREAILVDPKTIKARRMWLAFDERLIQAQKRHITNFLNLENPYTGRRYADDEAVAIWELHNEHQLVKHALESGFETWPQYFRDKLTSRWNQWLAERYAADSDLHHAWGELAEGESLGNASVSLGPTLSQRKDASDARASDFVRFITTLVGDYYQDLEAHARAEGTPGKGVAVVPFSYDTQYRHNIPWHYSAAGHADVSNFGMYYWQITSALTRDPQLYVMDALTIADKPTVIYETNNGRPNPYRGEQAFINTTLASHLDWDAVFFHYYHTRYGGVDEAYLAMAMPMATESHYWSAVEIERDPLMLALVAIAGQAFLQASIAPATDPIIYELGEEAIFSYKHYSGPELSSEAFDQGAKLRFVPEGNFGVQRRGGDSTSPQNEFKYEKDKGRLIIDTPTCKAYVGPTVDRYRFNDGFVVGNFDTDWVVFAIVSADGKPLVGDDAAQSVFVNARKGAHNRGHTLDTSGVSPGGGFINPSELIRRTTNRGSAPVIEDAIPFTLWLPFEASGRYEGYDFATRKVFDKPLSSPLVQHDGTPLFIGRLVFDRRGDNVDTPAASDVPTPAAKIAAEAMFGESEQSLRAGQVSEMWSPVAGLQWHMEQRDFDRAIRESGWKVERDNTAGIVTLFDVELADSGRADVSAVMSAGRLVQLNASYRMAPTVVDLVNYHSEHLGQPSESRISENAFEISEVQWQKRAGNDQLNVILTATQGNASVQYRFETQ